MIIGIDPGVDEIEAADAIATALSGVLQLDEAAAGAVIVATHTVQVGRPRFALSLNWPDATVPDPDALWRSLSAAVGDGLPTGTGVVATWAGSEDARSLGPDEAVAGAWVAVLRLARGDSGRVVVFPGGHRVRGVMSAADLIAASGVAAVTDLAGAAVERDTEVTTAGFVRPRWRGGSLVLQVQPGPQGTTVLFERAVEPDEEL